jgi:hypothetical protein
VRINLEENPVSTPIPPNRRKSSLRLPKAASGENLLANVPEVSPSVTAAHALSFNSIYTDTRGFSSTEDSKSEAARSARKLVTKQVRAKVTRCGYFLHSRFTISNT